MQGAGLGRPAALPVLRRATRPGGAHLPSSQRIQALIDAGHLERAPIHVLGQIRGASNTTVLARLSDPDDGPLVIYKPISGERWLWDFPEGTLAGRERAAYLLSEAGGWAVVPRTVLREGPRGPGMVQEWIGEPGAASSVVHLIRPGSSARGLIPVVRASDERDRPVLLAHEEAEDVRALAVLDVVLNNTDRKGAHAFRHAGRLYAVDHGVTFHVEDKLRTVLWGWAGEPLPDAEIDRLHGLAHDLAPDGPLVAELGELIALAEIAALRRRVADLLHDRRHPRPAGGWPAIPWPPI